MVHLAICQYVASNSSTRNLRLIENAVAEAAARGARIAVFPEATMARFGTSLQTVAEPLDGQWASKVAAVADRHDVLIVAGMFTPDQGGRVRNTLLITGQGQHFGYDKIHLYDAFGFQESLTIAPGSAIAGFELEGVRYGLATCYDLRFPELFRAHGEAGAAAVLVPASWGAGEGKREQWQLLVRARALDSGCWVAGVGQARPPIAMSPSNSTIPMGIGYSTVADGFGRVHAELGPDPELAVVELDPQRADAARAATGTLANRRLC